MSSQVEQWTDNVAERVRQSLGDKGRTLVPKEVRIHDDTDLLGEEAWRLVLVLPAPTGETWDRAEVFEVRRAAIDIFDAVATEDERALPGRTVAFVTTDEASENEIAPEEEPEEGEDPGRTS